MKNKIAIICLTVIAGLTGCTEKKSTSQPVEIPAVTESKKDGIAIIQQQSESDTLKGSLEAETRGTIGDTEIRISYHSPAVRGRIVWGGLVPFDKVWVTGAHMATSVEFNHDVLIGGTKVTEGKYAFFTIPGKDEWTIIVNKNWQQHLTDKYNEKDDVVRMKAKPEIESVNQERLRYVIEKETDTEGRIVVTWEKVHVSLPFSAANGSNK